MAMIASHSPAVNTFSTTRACAKAGFAVNVADSGRGGGSCRLPNSDCVLPATSGAGGSGNNVCWRETALIVLDDPRIDNKILAGDSVRFVRSQEQRRARNRVRLQPDLQALQIEKALIVAGL